MNVVQRGVSDGPATSPQRPIPRRFRRVGGGSDERLTVKIRYRPAPQAAPEVTSSRGGGFFSFLLCFFWRVQSLLPIVRRWSNCASSRLSGDTRLQSHRRVELDDACHDPQWRCGRQPVGFVHVMSSDQNRELPLALMFAQNLPHGDARTGRVRWWDHRGKRFWDEHQPRAISKRRACTRRSVVVGRRAPFVRSTQAQTNLR